jgi:hypothetical protein
MVIFNSYLNPQVLNRYQKFMASILSLTCLIVVLLLGNFSNHQMPAFLSQTYHCRTQSDELTKTLVYVTAEKEPENEGGLSALIRKFTKEIKLDSIPDDLDTKFIVAFVVTKEGQIIGERIVKDKAGGTVGRQMIKIARSFKWTPAECDGKQVPMLVKIPLQVCLREY